MVTGCARAIRLLRRPIAADQRSTADPAAAELTAVAAECAHTVLDACLAASRRFRSVPRHRRRRNQFRGSHAGRDVGLRGVDRGRGRLVTGRYETVGRSLLDTAAASVGDDGLLRPACSTPGFDRPGISAEAQSWFLLARRRRQPADARSVSRRIRDRPPARGGAVDSRTMSVVASWMWWLSGSSPVLCCSRLLQRDPAHGVHRLAHGGQRRGAGHRGRGVVVANHGQVLGHLEGPAGGRPPARRTRSRRTRRRSRVGGSLWSSRSMPSRRRRRILELAVPDQPVVGRQRRPPRARCGTRAPAPGPPATDWPAGHPDPLVSRDAIRWLVAWVPPMKFVEPTLTSEASSAFGGSMATRSDPASRNAWRVRG